VWSGLGFAETKMVALAGTPRPSVQFLVKAEVRIDERSWLLRPSSLVLEALLKAPRATIVVRPDRGGDLSLSVASFAGSMAARGDKAC